jgi:hypothetical protein
VIRNNKAIRSWLDAQGFRINGRKLNVKLIGAYIYHYGWVRNPVAMQKKYADFSNLWNEGEAHEQRLKKLKSSATEFDYSKIDSVTLFTGTHPAVMQDLVSREDWKFDLDIKKKNFKNVKHRFLYFLWKQFGWRPFEYSNYKKI